MSAAIHQNSGKTLLVMAGGTGGHVIPALAVADELRKRGHRIVWMGTDRGIEARLVPAAGYELKTISVSGLRGTGIMRKLTMPWMLLTAARDAFRVVKHSGANALLGMGGFASGPGALVGRMLGKPLLIHEQNALAGVTNQLVARLANRVLSGFSEVKGLGHYDWVGNPVKPDIVAIPAPSERVDLTRKAFRVLIVGGSQGAAVFNEFAPAQFAKWRSEQPLEIVHQSGKDRADAVVTRYRQLGVNAEVREFIGDMAAAYTRADVVLCRAGAMTISELSAAGVASLLVPFPHAVGDHQTINAQSLVRAGAAICISQADFESGKALVELEALAADRARLLEMSLRARRLARPNATADVADICEQMMGVTYA